MGLLLGLLSGAGMLAVMASGYLIMMGLLGVGLIGGVYYLFKGFAHAMFDETVDPFRSLHSSHMDIAFIEKEVDLRLIGSTSALEPATEQLKIAS